MKPDDLVLILLGSFQVSCRELKSFILKYQKYNIIHRAALYHKNINLTVQNKKKCKYTYIYKDIEHITMK